MDQQELNRILSKGEGLRIEFKKAQNGVPDTLYDSVVAFLNREGGTILLGVTDDAEVIGLAGQNRMQLMQDIVTTLNNPDVLKPPFPLAVNEVLLGSQTLLYIRVPVSSFVHKHRGVVFDRENDSDFRITDEARIAAMYVRKRNVFTENQIFPGLSIQDLDSALFDKVRSRLPWLMPTTPG